MSMNIGGNFRSGRRYYESFRFIFKKNNDRKALTIYYTCGCPDKESTAENIINLIDSGADIIELGVPFSEPMADGPVIQAAAETAIKNNTTLQDSFDVTLKIRENRKEVPVVLFTYYNIIFKYGVEKALSEFAKAGGDALLIVDLPFEEQSEIAEFCEANNLHLIQLVAPETPVERMEKIAQNARGFIYMVTVNGVTGERSELPSELAERLAALKSLASVPVLAGFGVSDAETAKSASAGCDGVIVGSAVMKRMLELKSNPAKLVETCELVASIRDALK